MEVLNQIREGSVSKEVLELLNDRVDPDFIPGEDWVTLTSRRRTVDEINQQRLTQLTGEKLQSVAERNGEADTKDFPGNEVLDYAVGARVMTVVNDPAGDYVNGSFGTISAADTDMITVTLDNGNRVELKRHVWESKRPVLDGGRLTSEVMGTIRQFPVILAWAITIHKSQGKTIPKCHINLKGGTTTDGQFYVAISRAVDLENLRFNQPVAERNINADGTLVRMIQRESAPEADTSRMVFLSFEGVNFSVSQHIARIHAVIVVNGKKTADFGSWINPMSDLGTFGEKYQVPGAGLAMTPSLGEFWPLLRRQAAGGLIVADKLAMFERAIRHQEKGMEIGLGIGYDISDLDYIPNGDDVITRSRDMADAYLGGKFAPHRGRPAPAAALDTEGSVYVPEWAPPQPMMLDPARATDSDVAWAALSGAAPRPAAQDEISEALEIMSDWAISRGGWDAGRRAELLDRAARITPEEFPLPEVETRKTDPAVLFAPGTRVAFTVQIALNGKVLRKDDELGPICEELGLVYKKNVSKSRCDVLVAGDVATMSNKGQAAREHGKPVVSVQDFETWYNTPASAPSLEEAPAGAPTAEESRVEETPVAEVPTESVEQIPAASIESEVTVAGTSVVSRPLASADAVIRPAAEVLSGGTRVAFRGSVYVDGKHFPHGERLQELCNELGLDYKQAVTRTRCDVLISDVPDALDGKAKLAAMYDKPTVLTSDFEQWARAELESLADEEEDETYMSPAAPPLTAASADTEPRAVPVADVTESEAGPEEISTPERVSDNVTSTVPIPNAVEELFQGRTFAAHNQVNDGLALVSGDTAWLCGSRAELLHRLGSIAAPATPAQEQQPAYGNRVWWSIGASFLLFWSGAIIGASGLDTVGVILVLVSFVAFAGAVYSAVKWAGNKRRQAKLRSQPQEIPLERSLGGPVEDELPVLLVDQQVLSPTQRSVASELTGLYGWLRAQGQRIDVHEWRNLSHSTLDAVAHFERSGDFGLVSQASRRIESLVNHSG